MRILELASYAGAVALVLLSLLTPRSQSPIPLPAPQEGNLAPVETASPAAVEEVHTPSEIAAVFFRPEPPRVEAEAPPPRIETDAAEPPEQPGAAEDGDGMVTGDDESEPEPPQATASETEPKTDPEPPSFTVPGWLSLVGSIQTGDRQVFYVKDEKNGALYEIDSSRVDRIDGGFLVILLDDGYVGVRMSGE